MLRRWSNEHGKYCSFLSMKLYSLHRATSFYTDLQLIAPLIFYPAKDTKILGVFAFLAPVKPLTVNCSEPVSCHLQAWPTMNSNLFSLWIASIPFRKSVNSTLFLSACKTKIADDPFLRALSPFCLFSRPVTTRCQVHFARSPPPRSKNQPPVIMLRPEWMSESMFICDTLNIFAHYC